MKRNLVYHLRWFSLLPLLLAAAAQMLSSQSAASPPVPYSSVSQLNVLLSQLEQAAQSSQVDLAKLRVERWKADTGKHRIRPAQFADGAARDYRGTAELTRESRLDFQAVSQPGCALRRIRVAGRIGGSVRLQG